MYAGLADRWENETGSREAGAPVWSHAPMHPLLAEADRPRSEPDEDSLAVEGPDARQHPLLSFDPFEWRPSVEFLPPPSDAVTSIWGVRTEAPPDFAAEFDSSLPLISARCAFHEFDACQTVSE